MGTETWERGRGRDEEMWDSGTQDAGTRGLGDSETWDSGTWDAGTWRRVETRGRDK